jgi:hypothetical protein
VLTIVFVIFAAAGVFAGLYYLGVAGARAGDRPGDALVATLLTVAEHPEGSGSLIVATVRNPSGTPVFAALRARRDRIPAWLAEPHDVSVPVRTLRPKFRPSRYGCVGIVPAGGEARLALPAPARARRYQLTVAIGQEGGRLRVHRLRLGPAGSAAAGRGELSPAVPRR